ncbi:spore coat protein U domain-containing protein [Deefgea salmonis]|uniref:Spore coat U domain-containing protein n=1 Tax=Deefgea salmonis TaxID=2875502 RepID=A0ABS8BMY4_9NEIS|nr:spore coat protein U domain-containing protein [Deefgea salmonis]MCB5196851.1 spore coat U domain-containing protein [Deefgea salmonis]
MKHSILGLIFCGLNGVSIAASCHISLPTGDLGGYEPAVNEAGISVQQAFWITCPKGVPLQITAGPSQTSSNIQNRQMRNSNNASSRLNYQLCHSYPGAGTCSRIFGDGQVGLPLTATATGVQQGVYFWTHVYGKQKVESGEYIDYVPISINP